MDAIAWDFDDTLADWRAGFCSWMASKGSIPSKPLEESSLFSLHDLWPEVGASEMSMNLQAFNLTPEFASLPAIPDAWAAVKEAERAGWRSIAITAPGRHPDILERRMRQLAPFEFHSTHVLGSGSEKIDCALDHGAVLLVDDSPAVLAEAIRRRFPYVVFDRTYNRHLPGPRVRSWSCDLPVLLQAAKEGRRSLLRRRPCRKLSLSA